MGRRELEGFPLHRGSASLNDRERNLTGPKMLSVIQLASHIAKLGSGIIGISGQSRTSGITIRRDKNGPFTGSAGKVDVRCVRAAKI